MVFKKYLLLAEKFLSTESAASEIINLRQYEVCQRVWSIFSAACMGEYEAFLHILKSALGIIKNKIDIVLGKTLSAVERELLAALICYPERIRKCGEWNEEWQQLNLRTLASQVPEELFQKIKDYLQRNNMTQKEFVIGLIETEIERDLTQRQAVSEALTTSEKMEEEQTETQETAAVSDCESVSEEVEEELEEQDDIEFSDNFEAENGEYESIDEELEEEQESLRI